MKRFIFIFIIIIIVTVSIDWVESCQTVKSDVELFGQSLTYAEMYEYKSKEYDFVIRVPSFFYQQPDSLQEHKGRLRFEYANLWATVVLDAYAMYNQGQSIREGMDSLAQQLHATNQKRGKDFFILSGPQYEQGSYVEGYSYYSKFVKKRKFWFVYTMVYPARYKPVLTRLFKEIDNWQVFTAA